jgi:hypothetical protein
MSGFAFHIIGAGRGGTSLVAALIDTHPDCEVYFEELSTNFLLGRVRTDAETMHDPAPRAKARIANFIGACEAHAAAFPGKLWGHKTTTEHIEGLGSSVGKDVACVPASGTDTDALEMFVESVADIHTIFILRDGRTCVRSKVMRTGQPIEEAVRRWKYSVRVMNAFKARAAHLLVVKFEELITYPEATMREVCAFLGVAYVTAVLEGTASIKLSPEYRSKIFDRSKLVLEDHADQKWVDDIRPELIANGYHC